MSTYAVLLSKTVHIVDPDRRGFTLCGARAFEVVEADRETCRSCRRLK